MRTRIDRIMAKVASFNVEDHDLFERLLETSESNLPAALAGLPDDQLRSVQLMTGRACRGHWNFQHAVHRAVRRRNGGAWPIHDPGGYRTGGRR